MAKIKTAIIPAAGFGTRMLPATKAIPKEMLPIGTKPAIQYIVEELVGAGIENIIIVTGYHKRAIEDHFDNSFELSSWLKKTGKTKELEEIKKISNLANFTFVRQKEGYGNAVPIISARHLLEDEPFMLLWGDIIADYRRTQRAIEAFQKFNSPILCSTPKTEELDFTRYGYIDGHEVDNNKYKVTKIIEKPGSSKGNLGLAVMNGYLLTPGIFKYIEKISPNKNGELCIIDAISDMAKNEDMYSVNIADIKQYDMGNFDEYVKTFLHYSKNYSENG